MTSPDDDMDNQVLWDFCLEALLDRCHHHGLLLSHLQVAVFSELEAVLPELIGYEWEASQAYRYGWRFYPGTVISAVTLRCHFSREQAARRWLSETFLPLWLPGIFTRYSVMLTDSVLKSRHLALVLITLLGLSPTVAAGPSVPPSYVRAAQVLQMPAEIAFLAALASSGVRLDDGCFQPWPWTLTLGSVTRHYPNRAEAHAALLAARHQGVTPIKVGLLQLDSQHVMGSLNEILDPATNLSVGLQALQQRYRQRHDWGVAITTLARRFHRFGVAGFCKPKLRVRAASYPLSSRHGQRRHITTLVSQLAPRFTIDPALVLAVIAQESAFNPSALSNKQAQGLMQLIPETAQRFGVRDPFDPEDNIRGGIAYLHFLLRHFQGDVALTLAAYNAGEKAVDKYQGIPPYPETRHYVRRIMAHYPRTVHPVPPPLKS